MTTLKQLPEIKRTYKSRIFTMIYRDKKELLELYEHQSTYNPNMALRFLYYLSDLYSNLTKDMNLYGSSLIQIPAPRFVVFYNGVDERPEYEEIKLSELYITRDEKVFLELLVDVYNINPGFNRRESDYRVYCGRHIGRISTTKQSGGEAYEYLRI